MCVVHVSVFQVCHVHGDKRGFLFLDVQELDVAFLSEIFEGEVSGKALLGHFKLVALDGEERSDTSASVGVDFDFILDDVLDD